ncbi:MAG TPA: (2Fe-2S)-binding protein [Terriglobales bacterium]|nr:(2Fe-2S)-binding protein [Terriglobales bacterium]
MPEEINISVNGKRVAVSPGTTVAAAIMLAGAYCRKSVSGAQRGPFCGMGICFECRAEINGMQHSRSCQIPCIAGMEIRSE